MAVWRDVERYVEQNFTIADRKEGFLQLLFETGIGRSQVVFVTHAVSGSDEQWAHIESVVGPAGDIALADLLLQVNDLVCGGLSRVGDLITLRHTVPLLNLDINEFVGPLLAITNSADRLEKAFAGGDRY